VPQQTPEELRGHLRDQIEFLDASCQNYDTGRSAFVKQAAVAMRVLFHDTAGQMVDGNLATSSNLTVMRVTTTTTAGDTVPSFEPVLDDYKHRTFFNRPTAFGHVREPAAGRALSFDEWWAQPVVRDDQRTVFSRRSLVLALSNQDGGAHVDASVGEAYHRLTRSNSLGYSSVGNSIETPFGSPVPAAVRQIAHEALRSFPRSWSREA
jgi:hypothetical protein